MQYSQYSYWALSFGWDPGTEGYCYTLIETISSSGKYTIFVERLYDLYTIFVQERYPIYSHLVREQMPGHQFKEKIK